jgi:soluble lytic murein transglycosylase
MNAIPGLVAAFLISVPAAAAVPEASRAYYVARLAENAAGRFSTLALSPLSSAPTDPLLETVVQWDRLRRDTYRASFSELSGFLTRNRGWPQEVVIRRRAEKALDASVPFAQRTAYFNILPPVTAAAKFRLAEAQLVSRSPTAGATARDAYDSSGLDAATEAELLSTFGDRLQPADHLSRLGRLLWTNQATAAARVMPRVAADRQGWAAARLALQAGGPDADAARTRLPAALAGEPGITYDRVQWLRRSGQQDAARAVMAATNYAPGLIVEPELWLKLRVQMAREALRAGDNATAYALAAKHAAFPLGRPLAERSLGERAAFIDAEWVAGWIALRELNRPSDALGHFVAVRAAALTPVSQARGDYWSGRAAQAANMAPDANRYYAEAARHPDYFYGQLSIERLGRTVALPPVVPPLIAAPERARFAADVLVRATLALGDLGDRNRQTLFMRALVERADSPAAARLTAELSVPLARPDLGVLMGKGARSDGELNLVDFAYPQLNLPPELTPHWTMVHAIARQESQFDRAATSSADARGLMQLLPSTAAEQAGKTGLKFSVARLIDDPIYNATLGAGYYTRIRGSLGGSHVLAVAAYNAGPGNARKFVRNQGDPRLAGVDVIDWIEAVPLLETRTYIQRVLENAVVYDLLHPATAASPAVNRLSWYLQKSTPG